MPSRFGRAPTGGTTAQRPEPASAPDRSAVHRQGRRRARVPRRTLTSSRASEQLLHTLEPVADPSARAARCGRAPERCRGSPPGDRFGQERRLCGDRRTGPALRTVDRPAAARNATTTWPDAPEPAVEQACARFRRPASAAGRASPTPATRPRRPWAPGEPTDRDAPRRSSHLGASSGVHGDRVEHEHRRALKSASVRGCAGGAGSTSSAPARRQHHDVLGHRPATTCRQLAHLAVPSARHDSCSRKPLRHW